MHSEHAALSAARNILTSSFAVSTQHVHVHIYTRTRDALNNMLMQRVSGVSDCTQPEHKFSNAWLILCFGHDKENRDVLEFKKPTCANETNFWNRYLCNVHPRSQVFWTLRLQSNFLINIRDTQFLIHRVGQRSLPTKINPQSLHYVFRKNFSYRFNYTMFQLF